MARSNSNRTNGAGGVLKFFGAAAAAIAGGIAIGFLFGGMHPARPVEPVEQQPQPVVSTPTAPVVPHVVHPHLTNGDYTAPGAPRIAIHEESTPIMRRVDRIVPAISPDPEAAQEAAPPAKPARPNNPAAPAAPSSDSHDASAPPAPANGGDTTFPSPSDNSAPPAPPPAPADPDFERVGKPGDSESGQEGGGKAQFRVQTGAYTDESKARSDADQLRSEGFNTSTRSEREGDHLVYKVQVGAYRSKAGANKAADDLQKKGYPAYISPMGP